MVGRVRRACLARSICFGLRFTRIASEHAGGAAGDDARRSGLGRLALPYFAAPTTHLRDRNCQPRRAALSETRFGPGISRPVRFRRTRRGRGKLAESDGVGRRASGPRIQQF